MSENDRRFGTSADARRLRAAAPYAVTAAVVAILLLIGLLRSPATTPSQTAAVLPPPSLFSAPFVSSSPVTRSPAPSRTTTTTTAPTVAPATTTTTPKLVTRVVGWVRDLGLTGGGGSYQEAFLAELARGECDELLHDVAAADPAEADERTRTLYRSAAQACLAAFGQRPELWPAAAAGLAKVPSGPLGCIDRSVHDLTRGLLDLHRTEPATVLRRGAWGESDSVGCPRVLSIDPESGPAAGGYPVVIIGEHLPNPAVIHFGFDATITVATTGGARAVLTVPPPGPNDYPSAVVWVDGWPFESTHAATFTYDPPTSSGP